MRRHKSVAEHNSRALAALQVLSHPEQLVAAFLNLSTIGFGICDEQLRYQIVNQTLAAMNGVSVQGHLGKTVNEILGERAYPVERLIKRVLTTGQAVLDGQITAKRSSGLEVGHWIGSYFPIRDDSGRVKQVCGIIVEVTQQRKLEESLRKLTRMLLRAQDEEQRRIARDLHDSINQYHAALKMNLLKLRRNNIEPGKRGELLSQSIELLDHCMAETRTISYLLHPPLLDEMGFISATRWYAKGFAQRSGIKVSLDLPSEMERLPTPVENALFRVVQESLTNVHRHAHASGVRIELEHAQNEIILKIEDDGRGIPAETLRQLQESSGAGGLGLASMNERIRELRGVLQVESSQGTIIRATIPVDPEIASNSGKQVLAAGASA